MSIPTYTYINTYTHVHPFLCSQGKFTWITEAGQTERWIVANCGKHSVRRCKGLHTLRAACARLLLHVYTHERRGYVGVVS